MNKYKRLDVQINGMYLTVYDDNHDWTDDYEVYLSASDNETNLVPILSDEVIGTINSLIFGVY